jgi:hypothetical protein
MLQRSDFGAGNIQSARSNKINMAPVKVTATVNNVKGAVCRSRLQIFRCLWTSRSGSNQ